MFPYSVRKFRGPRGGGAKKVMKSLNFSTPEPSSLRPGAGLPPSRVQSPCGQFSSGKIGLVMPISFRYASPENTNRLGTCAFQPNLPSAGPPVMGSVTMLGLPAVEGLKIAWISAIARKVLSGVASTRPRPKSGVVRRLAITVASGGTTSGTKSAMAWSCSNEPPCPARGSKTPSNPVRPKRVSNRWLVPPTAVPGPRWQATQDASLNTGPSPSSTSSTAENSALPSSNLCASPALRPGSGSPKSASAAAERATAPRQHLTRNAVMVALLPRAAVLFRGRAHPGATREDGQRVHVCTCLICKSLSSESLHEFNIARAQVAQICICSSLQTL